jgi:hypothetical protein
VYIFIVVILVIIGAGGCIQQNSDFPPVPLIQQTLPVSNSVAAINRPDTVTSPVISSTPGVMRPLVPLDKTIKDSILNFAVNVPENWNGTTTMMNNPEGYEGLSYSTSFILDTGTPVSNENEEFSIITYAITRGQDQDLRNNIRTQWIPKPQESTVMIQGITVDRFQSDAHGYMTIAYVVRKGSANEKGFDSLIYVNVSEAKSTYGVKIYEEIVQSVRYLTQKEIDKLPAEETDKKI